MSDPTAPVLGERPDEPPRARPPAPLRRNREFTLLWSGEALSGLGSSMANLAFPLLVLALTGSAVHAGAVATVSEVCGTALQLPAGALVDRWNRRVVMLVSDGIRALAFGVLGALIATHHGTFAAVLGVAAVTGAAGVFFSPAETAALRHIVPTGQLGQAAASNEARQYGAELVGPPLGGLLFGLAHAVPFLADAVSFLASLAAVATIRTPLQDERPAGRSSLRADIVEGLRFAVGHPLIRVVLVGAMLINAGLGGAIFAIVVVLRQGGLSASLVGTAATVVAIGGLAGALLAGWLNKRVPPPVLIRGICWMSGPLLVVTGLLGPHLAMVVPIAAIMFLAPAVNTALFAYQIAITPDRLQARVVTVISLFAGGLGALAPVGTGYLLGLVGTLPTFGVLAAVVAAAAVVVTVSREVGRMRPLSELGADDVAGAAGRSAAAVTDEPA